MKKHTLTYKLVMLAIVAVFLTAAVGKVNRQIAFFIEKTSELTLSGTSNVADYSCNCDDLLQTADALIIEEAKDSKLVFKNATLKLKTKGFDCGNSLITGEMHSALQAKTSPYIYVNLVEIDIPDPTTFLKTKNKWYQSNGMAYITIAGKKKLVSLLIKSQRTGDNTYRFGGTKNLLMTDFEIDPPKPTMGLIRVANEVKIELDLRARMVQ